MHLSLLTLVHATVDAGRVIRVRTQSTKAERASGWQYEDTTARPGRSRHDATYSLHAIVDSRIAPRGARIAMPETPCAGRRSRCRRYPSAMANRLQARYLHSLRKNVHLFSALDCSGNLSPAAVTAARESDSDACVRHGPLDVEQGAADAYNRT